MRIEIRPQLAVALLFAVLLLTVGGSIASSELDEPAQRGEIATESLEDGSELWPYTSRGETTSQRTLALNVIVYGDADVTERYLRERSMGDWEELEAEEADVAPEEEAVPASNETSSTAWGQADGANRFTYVETPSGQGYWLPESYQLKDGTYLGERHHIRAYTDPAAGNWTAMQAHHEHWDWFQLRHTVHGIEQSQSYVDAEFKDRWFVEELIRTNVGNDRSADADGWMTVVTLRGSETLAILSLLLVGSIGWGSMGRSDVYTFWNDDAVRGTINALLVVTSIVAFYTLIRVAGIEAEQFFADAPPKAIVSVLYPSLVVGLPVIVYLGSRHLSATHAFTAASLGFVVAMFFDYTNMGVTTLPLNTIVHQAALATALGFVAAGASQTARSPVVEPGHVRTGVLLWAAAMAIPLLRYLGV
ncbi:hypothetical protein Halru_2560 [Halovivax ruber XH-70]|uniref:Uncharacterized protein n=1 Tax=Halovivax ruber (strain DSM 18193 / JCM 13892 / XH-70) TaxID=797302 RepID=L0IFY4_HALRX|nr:hypothetical protein [Halovivax ruber]AGB17141.1 hypothetical protein Halru_2560 [Halovivax ruber XH-70]